MGKEKEIEKTHTHTHRYIGNRLIAMQFSLAMYFLNLVQIHLQDERKRAKTIFYLNTNIAKLQTNFSSVKKRKNT